MIKLYEDFCDPEYDSLNESEKISIGVLIESLSKENLEELNESLLSNIIGGTLGFIIGPSLGKRIANALGIEKGPLFDLFTSRLVNTAIGMAISKGVSGGYKKDDDDDKK